MNVLRIAMNVALTGVLGAGGLFLLFADGFLLRNRWDTGGYHFTGLSQYLLAGALFAMAAFAAAVTMAWATGRIPMPRKSEFRPHPTYRGEVLLAFWYFPVSAILLLLLAFYLAEAVPPS